MAPHANGVKDSGRGRGAKRGSPRASLGPSRCDFDPLMVLPSRRDNGNKAQGRGASPRTLGMRVVYETSVEPKTTSTTRVFRDRNTRRVTSGACRVGVKRTAGCFGLGVPPGESSSWARTDLSIRTPNCHKHELDSRKSHLQLIHFG